MKVPEWLSGAYWYALYQRERSTRDEDAALIARLKRENKRLRERLLETVGRLKEASRREG